MSISTHYTFGDTDLAAERLRLLAAAFAANSAEFIRRASRGRPSRVLDLGCGPGFTTLLLESLLAPESTVGLDASARFIQLAHRVSSPKIRFHECDVSRRLPYDGVDVLYSRFLLTHLPDPSGALTAWFQTANPGALLLLEETEAMRSTHPALERYYGIVAAMQRHYGQAMTIGASLEALARRTPWIVQSSRLSSAELDLAQMARIHHLNIATWKRDPFVRDRYASSDIEALEAELSSIAENASPGTVTCEMRQVILGRPAE